MLKNQNNPVRPVLFLLVLVLLYSGCTGIKPEFRPPLESDSRALEAAERLSDFNREITASKGTGLLTIAEKNRRIQYRIAWAARSPDQARITLLSSGMPVETFLFNKDRITLYSHTGQHAVKTYSAENPSLEKVLSVPVRMNDIISILTGQIPVQPFDSARFEDTDNREQPRSLLLNSLITNGMQRLIMDSGGGVREFSLLKNPEQPIYRLRFGEFENFSSCGIFTRMAITNESGESAVFRIYSFQKNPDVKDSVFNLTKEG